MQRDFEVLKKYCSTEVIERCKAEKKAFETQGIFFENKVRGLIYADQMREIYTLNPAFYYLEFDSVRPVKFMLSNEG